jgi:4-hydroxy-tetrahydrodipicolinate synthase
LAGGGDGCISMVANLYPDLCRVIHEGCATGNLRGSRNLSGRIAALGSLLAEDSPVAALKYGMSVLGFMRSTVRLPLVELGRDARKKIFLAMTAVDKNNQVDRPRAAVL